MVLLAWVQYVSLSLGGGMLPGVVTVCSTVYRYKAGPVFLVPGDVTTSKRLIVNWGVCKCYKCYKFKIQSSSDSVFML